MLKNIVIIGYGNIARKHIEVLKALGCNIAATSNRSVEKRDMAMQEGISMVYSDYHQMIQKEKPDGIIVCVSFWNMFTVLSDIIPYGIPILAEKPTGTSLAEHKSLQVLASKYKTPIMVALNRRHYSVLNKAIELAGGKQNITNVLIEWSEDPFHLANKKKLNNELIHKTIFENTIHGLDLLTYLAGEISDINISAVNLGDPFRWIMNISGKSDTNTIYNFNSSMDNFVPWRVVFYAQNKSCLLYTSPSPRD